MLCNVPKAYYSNGFHLANKSIKHVCCIRGERCKEKHCKKISLHNLAMMSIKYSLVGNFNIDVVIDNCDEMKAYSV